MKAQPLRLTDTGYQGCQASDATHLMLNMPGPIPTRILPVITHGTRRGTPCWSWNGDTEKPTLKPSILTRGGSADAEIRCHTFVNDGMVLPAGVVLESFGCHPALSSASRIRDGGRTAPASWIAPGLLCSPQPPSPPLGPRVAPTMVQFLSDCTHELAGQTVPLLDVEYQEPT